MRAKKALASGHENGNTTPFCGPLGMSPNSIFNRLLVSSAHLLIRLALSNWRPTELLPVGGAFTWPEG